MPKRAKELTAVEVKRLDKRGLHAVGGVAGLLLQVGNAGSRSWILRARIGSKRRDIGLGGFPDVTLAMARDKARKARERIEQGVDVVAERAAARQSLIAAQAKRMTFADAAREKHAAIAAQFRSVKHRKDWIRRLELYAFPVIGEVDVADIELAHVKAVLSPIWHSKTDTARRVRGSMEAVITWATVTGHRKGDNPARWRGNLAEVLPKPGKVAKKGHHKALPWPNMFDFMQSLHKREGTGARALEFAILTAARSGEVRGMTWDEVDMRAGIWTIPGERMKAGKAHTVPLSDAAKAIIEAQPHMAGSEYVFAAARGGQLSDMSLSAVTRRMEVDAVPHGFRSSFKDWARNRTSFADEVSEIALAHINSDATRAAYARDELLPQRARLMRQWAEFCAVPFTQSGGVTDIGSARA